MNNIIAKLELVTELLGTFTFKNHFNSTADFYQAMCLFESNNWKMLGECSYIVHHDWEDGAKTQITFSRSNATAELSEYMNDENNQYV